MIDILAWFGVIIIPFFLLIDTVQGVRKYETPKYWKVRGILITAVAVYVSIFIGTKLEGFFSGISIFDNSQLSLPLGVLLGILTYNLGHYAYHRTVHSYDIFFQSFHQFHHSAEGIDSYSAYYLHPLDLLGFTTVSSFVFFPLLGLSLEAGLIALAFNGFNAIFQHININTPQWLGYIIQRPESHCIHHEKGLHAFNYADLPLIDMIFGTFRNPKSGEHPEAGYYNGASKRLLEMFLCQDVSKEKD